MANNAEPDLERVARLRIVVQWAAPVALALFYLRAAGHFDVTPDQTYVYLQYAHNIASGQGFVFNIGEHVLAVASPLWTLLIAGGAATGLDPFVVAKVLDLVFAAFAILAFQSLVLALTENRVIAVMGAVALTLDGWLLQWAGSGMETSLALLLTMIAVKHAVVNDKLSFAAATALLTLTRPEGILLFVLGFAVNAEGGIRHIVQEWRGALGLYVGVVCVWVVYATRMFGSPFPTIITGVVELGSAAPWLKMSITPALVVIGTQFAPFAVLVYAAFLLRNWMNKDDLRTLILMIGWPLILCLLSALRLAEVSSRLLVPGLPLILAGMWWLVLLSGESSTFPMRRALISGIAAVLISVTASQVIYLQFTMPHMKANSEAMQIGVKPIAYWLRNNTDVNASVLAPEIGLVGYISERRVWTPEESASRSLPRSRYIIDRTSEKERLASNSIRPIMTTEITIPASGSPVVTFVTLYVEEQ